MSAQDVNPKREESANVHSQQFIRIPIVCLSVILIGAVVAHADPRLIIKKPTFDFGYAPQHSQLSHTFILHSTGDDSLRILNVIPGCGCTEAPLKKKTLAPGDSTALEVIFSTRSYRSHVSKRPVIKTNEGPPDKHVQFTAIVVTRPDSTYPLIITPYKLDLSQFGDKQRRQAEFSIQNLSEKELAITLVSSAPEFFDLKIPGTIGPGKTADCKLTLKPPAMADSLTKSFTIAVNDDKSSRFTVPVKRSILHEHGPTNVTNGD